MTDHDREPDDSIAATESAQEQEGGADTSPARRFDIRRIIGGLFLVYGVALVVQGLFDGETAKEQAAGIHINLWTGLAMLLVGAIFLVWMRLNPVQAPAPSTDDDRPAH